MRLADRSQQAYAEKVRRQSFDLRGIQNHHATVAYVVCELRRPFIGPIDPSTSDEGRISIDRVFVCLRRDQNIEDVAENTGHE